ncbi:MAG: Ig-like domain repeat protein, partial [Candidatus Omnitrophica bacterium]|nr:Ig-like domain repeat protein [Candidatus Omnitrophota bacterium]
ATTTWNFTVQPSHLTPGAFAKLWVQALDAAGNASPWLSRRVFVGALDTTPPLLAITIPSVDGVLSSSSDTPFSGTATDAGTISRIRIYVYDEARAAFTVADATASYSAATGSWSFAVQAAHLTSNAYARLWVQALDTAGNASAWLSRRVFVGVPDTTAPAITMTSPTGSSLPPVGGTLSGTATDAGTISRIRIYVYDEARAAFTVSDAIASYTAATTTWNFTVQPSHLTPGAFAKLWVQALDAAGNASPWLSRRLLVQTAISQLGPSRVTVSGTQVLVARRQLNGTLSAAQPLKLRGVAYSPVDAGEVVESLQTARQHLRESRYAEDFALMQELGANAVKTYADPGTDGAAIALLDEAYQRGLMVAITLDPAMPQFTSVVQGLKDHPALLCWILGNEWNLNRLFRGFSLAEAAAAVEAAAQTLHGLDANHPVASSLGFLTSHYNLGPDVVASEFPAAIAEAPSVDLWGLNVYRGGSFDPLFLEWGLLSSTPFFLTEFGTDDWNAATGRVDEALQADTAMGLWDELHRHFSATSTARQCVGGFLFEWNDEWWKMSTPQSQDSSGFTLEQPIFAPGAAAPLAVFRGHPDGVSNEEHYGLVTLSRQRKQAFFAMQEAFRLGTTRLEPVPVAVQSAVDGAGSFAVFTKRGLPMTVRQSRGIHLVVIDRAAGTVSSIRRFDTEASPAAECAALRSVAFGVRAGDVVLGAIAGSGVPFGSTMASAVMAPCAEGLARVGSQRALEIGSQQSWALIGIAGAAAVNVAEGLGAAQQPAQAAADILLDADRDGLTDALDADNDNDGLTDQLEWSNGTDILDPERR